MEELPGKIIFCATEVHKKLGQTALLMELAKQKLKMETQKVVKIIYDGEEIGLHRLDLVVEGQIIVELKAVKEFDDSYTAQLIPHLNASGLKV